MELDNKCPKCAMPLLNRLGCFASTCNRDRELSYHFSGTLHISEQITCENKEDAQVMDFIITRFAPLEINKTGSFECQWRGFNPDTHGHPLRLISFYYHRCWYIRIEYKDIGPSLLTATIKDIRKRKKAH